jgi:hypothetical protein
LQQTIAVSGDAFAESRILDFFTKSNIIGLIQGILVNLMTDLSEINAIEVHNPHSVNYINQTFGHFEDSTPIFPRDSRPITGLSHRTAGEWVIIFPFHCLPFVKLYFILHSF